MLHFENRLEALLFLYLLDQVSSLLLQLTLLNSKFLLFGSEVVNRLWQEQANYLLAECLLGFLF